MSSLSTLPKGDSAWLLRKSIQRIMQQVSVLETNIGSSTTGNSANTQVIFNDAGTLRGDTGLTFNKTTDLLTVGAATITGDLTVATDRLKVVTGSTAIQTGATTQLQVGTTSWPSTVIGKSGSRSLFGNAGEVIIWNESAAAIGNYSTLFVSAKTGAGATTMGGLQIRAGIENASNSDGFVSLWTSNSAAGGFVERYKIDSTGIATWSNVGGVAGTAMTLNATGLGVGGSPSYKLDVQGTSAGVLRLVNILNLSTDPAAVTRLSLDGQGATWHLDNERTNGIFKITRNSTACLTIDNSANVGIGVTPSATNSTYFQALELARVGQGLTAAKNVLTGSPSSWLSNNSYATYSSGVVWNYAISQPAAQYRLFEGQHQWYTAPSGTAGNAITFTERLRLKETGQLRFVPLASDPSGAEAGDVYYNSTSNKLKCYNGTTWNDLF